LSGVIGDVAHNLRAALDQLVCELIRNNRKQVRTRSGFPIATTEKRFEEAAIGKIEGVSPATAKFIRRLKPFNGGNRDLWVLHELDGMDKHVEIVPVAAGIPRILMNMRIPFGMTPEGRFQIGKWNYFTGVPADSKPVLLTKGEKEVYRFKPNPFQNPQIAIEITLGKTKILEGGEPIIALLEKLSKLVERIIGIAERRLKR
jgi:hypothetical protein